MKLILDGIKDRQAWEKAGIKLPGYDVEAVSEKAKEAPGWVHFGIGNIFRVFIGGIADGLLEEGVLDRGITCVDKCRIRHTVFPDSAVLLMMVKLTTPYIKNDSAKSSGTLFPLVMLISGFIYKSRADENTSSA